MDTAASRPLIYFACWQQVPAQRLAEAIGAWGYPVRYDYSYDEDELDDAIERMLAIKPAAIVLSLSELPGFTRSFALGLRANSVARKLPCIIVENGAPEQVEQTKHRCGWAQFSSWDGLADKLAEVLGGSPPGLPPDADLREMARKML